MEFSPPPTRIRCRLDYEDEAQRTRRHMSHETAATTSMAPESNVAAAASVCSVTAITAEATKPETSHEK